MTAFALPSCAFVARARNMSVSDSPSTLDAPTWRKARRFSPAQVCVVRRPTRSMERSPPRLLLLSASMRQSSKFQSSKFQVEDRSRAVFNLELGTLELGTLELGTSVLQPLVDLVEAAGGSDEGGEQGGVELARRVRGDEAHGLCVTQGRAVRAAASQGFINGHDRDQTRGQRNVLADQTVRIAGAVPLLVVAPGDFGR